MTGTDTDLLNRLARLDSTVISDALDACGLSPGTGALTAQGGSARFAGTTRTVQLGPEVGGEPGPHIASGAIAEALPGDVLVVANEGRRDVSCWGGLLSLGSVRQGVVGVIADGACRDVTEARSLGLPVFARAVTPRTARGRLRQQSAGIPVVIDGITVEQGDLVLGDDSGVAFIPRQRAAEVIGRAEQILARESAIAADIRSGLPINTAMHDARLAGRAEPGADAATDGRTPTERLAVLSTAAISDALDTLALPGSVPGMTPLLPGRRACGPAFTVAYEPIGTDGGTVGDFLDDVPAGAVIVIDNQGRSDATVWGGIMTRAAHAQGVAGTVISGVCRDVEEIAHTGYPMWSAGRFMRTGKDRVRLAAVQQPLSLGGVSVHPDDVVCGDADGIVVVPAEHATAVAEIAERIHDAEAAIIGAVATGSTLAAARSRHGYHRLQSTTTTLAGRRES
ncbi:RraA family protein [Mycobacterium sp. BMJ-28]